MKKAILLLGFLAAALVVVVVAVRLPAFLNYMRLKPVDRLIFSMDQGANVKIHFWGLVEDQDGLPVANAAIKVSIGFINQNWAYEGPTGHRGGETVLSLASDDEGWFNFVSKGVHMKITSITAPGYRWLYDALGGHVKGRPYADNRNYEIATEHKPGPYIPDPKSPAIFVLVRDGVKDVHVAPSRGGADESRYDTIVNEPTWPNNPSLKDVRYVGPETH